GCRSGPPQGQTNRRGSLLAELLDKEGADLGSVDVGRDEARADPARQDERQLTALDLLVLGNELHQAIDAGRAAGNLRGTRRQTACGEVALDALGLRRRNEPAPRRECEGEGHAERDRLAVQQTIGESGRGLERVTEGVAEIEQRALAGLALVAADDRR